MKDKFNREIDYMRISVTDKCNLNCFYCMPNDKDNPKVTHQLSDDEILRIIKVSVTQGITKFRLTGGEPLVRPGIFDLIKNDSIIEWNYKIICKYSIGNKFILFNQNFKLKSWKGAKRDIFKHNLNAFFYFTIYNSKIVQSSCLFQK